MAGKTARRAPNADRILDAALALAAETPWRSVTMEAVAERAGATLAAVRAAFPSKPALVRALIRRIDAEVLKGHDFGDRGESAHDRLLDVLLRRLDALGRYREAVRSIWRDTARDPLALACVAPSLGGAMAWSLEAAGIRAWGRGGALRTKGLAAIFASTLPVWLRDESEDLGPTAAHLDRSLRRAGRLARILWPDRGGPR